MDRAKGRAFTEQIKAYGSHLNTKSGEPSRLRYLHFLASLKSHREIDTHRLQRLIPALEAKSSYRQSYFREYPVQTFIAGLVALLVASLLGESMIWTSGVGVQLLMTLLMAWFLAFCFGRQWRSVRPTPEARERELLTFLHMAVMDLETASPTHRPATTSDISLPDNTP